MRMCRPVAMWGACLAALSAGPACFVSDTYSNLQLQGSTLVLSSSYGIADGNSPVTATVTLRSGQAPVANANVVLVARDCVVTPAYGVTDAQGGANFALTTKVSGQRVVAVQVERDSYVGQTRLSAPLSFLRANLAQDAVAGQAQDLVVVVQDANGNVDAGYAGTVTFTSTDAAATLPAPRTFSPNDTGQALLPAAVVFRTAGPQTVSVRDASGGAVIALLNFTVHAAAAAELRVSGAPQATAGVPVRLDFAAYDAFGNPATDYRGHVQVRSSDANAVLPPDTAASATGTLSLVVTLLAAGNSTVEVSDTQTPQLAWVGTLQVDSGAATTLLWRLGAQTVAAGGSTAVTVQAQDAYGNLATGYTGVLHVSSTDAAASLPSDQAAARGTLASSVSLFTAGAQTLRVVDTQNPALGSDVAVQVQAGDFARFVVQLPSTVQAGDVTTAQLVPADAFANPVAYSGTALISCTDPSCSSETSHTFTAQDGNAFVFPVVLRTAGAQSVQAADSVATSKSGAATVNVQAAALAALRVSLAASSPVAGVAQSATVDAIDMYGNLQPSYRGTVHLSSTDGAASLPGDALYSATDAGRHLFAGVVFKAAGGQTLTVSDGTLQATASVQVQPAAAATLQWSTSPAASGAACAALQPAPVVQAVDAFGNLAAAQGNVAVALQRSSVGGGVRGIRLQALGQSQAQFADLHVDLPGTYRLVAHLANPNTPLIDAVSAAFTLADAAPSVSVTSAAAQGGCMDVRYTVASACPVRTAVQVDPNNSGAFFTARGAPGSQGGAWRQAAASGSAWDFVWDATRDLPRTTNSSGSVRVRATTPGGATATGSAALTVATPLTFTAGAPQSLGGSGIAVWQDLNRDNVQDVVALGSNSLLSRTGQSDRVSWNALNSAALGGAPQGLAVADLTGDGIVDAVTSVGSAALLLAGVGDGSFAAPSSYALPNQAVAVAVADLNRDGALDIAAVRSAGGNSLDWLLQSSGGGFAAASSRALGQAPNALALADVDLDGITDAVIAAGSLVYVAKGSGSGFAAPASFAAAGATRVQVADVNRDGKPDVITGNGAAASVSLFLNTGSGSLAARVDTPVTGAVKALQVADLWGADGALDVAVLTATGLQVLGGNGHGTLAAVLTTAVSSGAGLALVDTDLDGALDAGITTASGQAQVLRNATPPACSWSLRAPRAMAFNAPPGAAAAADFNEDGQLDLVVTSHDGGLVMVAVGDGAGALTSASVAVDDGGPGEPAVGDVDGDGHVDLAVANLDDGSVRTYLGDGNAQLRPAANLRAPGVAQAALGDMDRDGRLDLIAAGASGAQIWLNQDSNWSAPAGYSANANLQTLAVGDLDGDGWLDVVTTAASVPAVVAWLGTGGGALQSTPTRSPSCAAVGARLADLTGDGVLDVALDCGSGAWSVLKGQGHGAFVALSSTTGSGVGLALADIDGDGRTDVLSSGDSRAYVATNGGDGSAFTVTPFSSQLQGVFVLAADFNGDGRADLATLHSDGASVRDATIDLNLQGRFTAPTSTPPVGAGWATNAVVVDVNNDGNPDVVSTDWTPELVLYTADANGALSLANTAAAPSDLTAVVVGDLNRDGQPDAVLVTGGDFEMRTFYAAGSAFTTPIDYTVGWGCGGGSSYALQNGALADMNRDGYLDLVTGFICGPVSAYPGGASGFDVASVAHSNLISSVARGQQVADLNRDGWLDLVMSDQGALITQLSSGAQYLTGSSFVTPAPLAQSLTMGDFDRDGLPDTLTLGSDGALRLYLGHGDGSMVLTTTVALHRNSIAGAVADLDGDGDLDVVASTQDATFVVLLGDGHGHFAPPRLYVADGQGADAQVADMNHDGRQDVVVTHQPLGQATAAATVRWGQ